MTVPVSAAHPPPDLTEAYPASWRTEPTVELPLDVVRRLIANTDRGTCDCLLCALAVSEARRYAWEPADGDPDSWDGEHDRTASR
jgi:hypothetical protein